MMINRTMKFPGKFALGFVLGLAVVLTALCPTHAADDALVWPPITSQTQPWAWWWWHGSAVDQTNIAHELQRFHDAGLGGVQITAIYGVKGEEAHEIPYLTPVWLAMMGYTVDEARRLGMGVDMSLGSGWCFGGPTVDREEANASVVVKTFMPAAGEKLPGKFGRDATQALVAFSPDGKAVDLTDKISTDGEVDWTAPAGSWTVYAISQQPSGQKVKRAAPGGKG
ncbi:MAG TPA: glycosyl hydrolase, partial [Phycisphaerae bacterium]|nr:glycosyl hydrolase [Phycisphaerae bacterium]